MTASTNRRYIPELDQVRGFAALLVLFYHGFQLFGARLAHNADFDATRHWVFASNPIIAFIEEGHSAVGLFIVLSGFVLSLGAIGNRVAYKPFLIARALRICPMLIVCLAVAVHTGPNGIASVLLLNVSGGASSVFTATFWAVAIEFQCYLVFPLLLAFSDARGSRFLLQIIAVALTLRGLAVMAESANPRDLAYWTVVGRIDQFCIGMIAARLYTSRNLARLSAWWFLPAALVAFTVLHAFNRLGGWPLVATWKIAWPPIEGAMWACFIVTYLAAGRRLPFWLSWLGAKLGEISYSVYLIHFAVLHAIIRHGIYVQPTGNGYYDALLTTLVVALPITVIISALTYATIELPFLCMRPKYIVRPEG